MRTFTLLTSTLLLVACVGPASEPEPVAPSLYAGRTAAEWAAIVQAEGASAEATLLEADRALVALGAESVPHLTTLLAHESETVRYAAATSLSRIGGPVTEPAAPSLVPLLRSDVAHLRIAGLRATGAMGEGATLLKPELKALLQDEDWNVRQAAALASGPMAKKDQALEEQLEAVARTDLHGKVRLAAQRALGAWGAQLPEDRD